MAIALSEAPLCPSAGFATGFPQAHLVQQFVALSETTKLFQGFLQQILGIQESLRAAVEANAVPAPAAPLEARHGSFLIGQDSDEEMEQNSDDGAYDFEGAFDKVVTPWLQAAKRHDAGFEPVGDWESCAPEPLVSRLQEPCPDEVEIGELPRAWQEETVEELCNEAVCNCEPIEEAREDVDIVISSCPSTASAESAELRHPARIRCATPCTVLEKRSEEGLGWAHASDSEFLQMCGRDIFEHLADWGLFERSPHSGSKEFTFEKFAMSFLMNNASKLGMLVASGEGHPRWPRWHPPLSHLRGGCCVLEKRQLWLLWATAQGLWCAGLQAQCMPRVLREPPRPPPRASSRPPQPAQALVLRPLGVDDLIQRVRQQRQLREAIRYSELASTVDPEPLSLHSAPPDTCSAVEPTTTASSEQQARTTAPCSWVAPIALDTEDESSEDDEKSKPVLDCAATEHEEEPEEPLPADEELGADAPCDWQERERHCQTVLREMHLQEAPRERRAHSWGRTLAYAKVVLGSFGAPMRLGTEKQPFVIWVLCATDNVEAWLAEEGFFDSANWVDEAPTEVVLVGNGMRTLQPQRPAAFGQPAVVSTASYARSGGLVRPDFVAVLMPSTRLVGSIPKHVLQSIEDVPAVVSTRFELHANDRSRLSSTVIFPQARCPFSACPDGNRMAHDDNGWIFGVHGEDLVEACSLKVPALPPPPNKAFAKKDRKPVVFWGILDIKYDTSLPVLDRVKILEAGEGKTSKFSGDGKEIRERFDTMYKLEEAGESTMHSVIASDKKFLHDTIQDVGYGHLLPDQACLLREYSPGLADDIAEQLGLSGSDHVVLKLCNKTRAAGVMVVPVHDLDRKLRGLLTPPRDMDAWFMDKTKALAQSNNTGLQPGQLEENTRHWWSNESPVFLAERMCSSLRCMKDGKGYDGTLRVGFALRPRGENLDVEWLGSYWKLPKRPDSQKEARLQECVISAARTSGTSHVDPVHCSEVYAALGDLLPRLFTAREPSLAILEDRHDSQRALAAYFTARFGAAKQQRINVVKAMLSQAESVLMDVRDGQAKLCTQSFVQRWRSIVVSKEGGKDFDQQNEMHLTKSLELMPSNANTLYIKGVKMWQKKQFEDAINMFHRSLVLDPDFKAPYVYLGVCHLQLDEFQNALEISEAGNARHPSPQFHYHIGVALANLGLDQEDREGFAHTDDRAEQWQKALDSLKKARSSAEAQSRRKERKEACKSPWLMYDDELINWLEKQLETRHTSSSMCEPQMMPRIGTQQVGWCPCSYRV